jgi:glycosyltransferase involved in cell wall biosynthesis
MTVTACLIVRDEAHRLRACLEPLAHGVNAIVVADTGSRDDTVEVARGFTDRVVSVPFNGDFSAARNAALEHVETDWVLFIDADETFDPPQLTRVTAAAARAGSDVLGMRVLRYDFLLGGGWFTSRRIKLFRNDPDVRFTGSINEDVLATIRSLGGLVEDADAFLNHFGHAVLAPQRRQKAMRYMAALRDVLSEDPADGLRHAYLGLHLRNVGRLRNALVHTREGVRLAPDEQRVHVFRGHVLRSSGRFSAARTAYQHARRVEPTYFSQGALVSLIGVTRLMEHDFERAEADFRRALELDPFGRHVDVNIGLIRESEGSYLDAARLYGDVARHNGAFLSASVGLVFDHDPVLATCYDTAPQFVGLTRHLARCVATI